MVSYNPVPSRKAGLPSTTASLFNPRPHHQQQALLFPSKEDQPTFLPLPSPARQRNQLTVDLEGSVSLVGPPFLCCKRNQSDHDPLAHELPPAPPLASPLRAPFDFLGWKPIHEGPERMRVLPTRYAWALGNGREVRSQRGPIQRRSIRAALGPDFPTPSVLLRFGQEVQGLAF